MTASGVYQDPAPFSFSSQHATTFRPAGVRSCRKPCNTSGPAVFSGQHQTAI